MDALAPNNPVIVNSSAFSFINSQASKLVEEELPAYWDYIKRYRAIVGPYDPEPVGGNIGRRFQQESIIQMRSVPIRMRIGMD